jgi:hypothetical protein
MESGLSESVIPYPSGKEDAMKTLWFLLWIPALVVFYLSLHDELVRERRRQSLARTPLASNRATHHSQ